MAFKHGIDATLSIAGAASAAYIESATMDLKRELAEIRVWGANSVARVAGLKDAGFSVSGPYEETIDLALYNAWAGAAAVAIVYSPDGGTTTYTISCWVSQYSPTTGSGDAGRWSATLVSTGDVARA